MSKDKNNESKVVPFPPQLEITLGDLSTVVRIIDVVTKRGAFEGAELYDVGSIRKKIVDFIELTQKQQQANQEATKTPPSSPAA